jgi:hypothetical protein
MQHEDERASLLLRKQSILLVTFDKAVAVLPMTEGDTSATHDILVEVHRGSCTMMVNWPLESATPCST